MYCNVSSIAELNKFRKQIENNLNGIDVLIDNGLTDRIDLQNEANDCRRVITILGDRVRTTINVSFLANIPVDTLETFSHIFDTFAVAYVHRTKNEVLVQRSHREHSVEGNTQQPTC